MRGSQVLVEGKMTREKKGKKSEKKKKKKEKEKEREIEYISNINNEKDK